MGQRRRIIVRACIFLVLGAIINVAVAWGCAFWSKGDPRTLELLGSDRAREIVQESFEDWSDEGLDSIQASEFHGAGVRRRQVISVHPPDRVYLCFDEWSGLPMRSLFGQRLTTELNDSASGGWLLPGLLWTDLWPGFTATVLPYRPLWPGFAINTNFYAAMLWLLLAFPLVIRRRIRIKRNQCASCGYPIGASDTCTECGSTVKRRNIDH